LHLLWSGSIRGRGRGPDIEKLRAFRDSTLAQSAVGRRIIEIYYDNAGSINDALENSPALSAIALTVRLKGLHRWWGEVGIVIGVQGRGAVPVPAKTHKGRPPCLLHVQSKDVQL
jgi:hypothetical protein